MTEEKTRKPATKCERDGLTTPVLDVHDAAAHLGVAALTVYRIVRRGELPVTRIGRFLRFRVEDLHRYLQERTVRERDRQQEGEGGSEETRMPPQRPLRGHFGPNQPVQPTGSARG